MHFVYGQIPSQARLWEKNRDSERPNGRACHGACQKNKWALEKKRFTGNALLLPLWLNFPHKKRLPTVQRTCRCNNMCCLTYYWQTTNTRTRSLMLWKAVNLWPYVLNVCVRKYQVRWISFTFWTPENIERKGQRGRTLFQKCFKGSKTV